MSFKRLIAFLIIILFNTLIFISQTNALSCGPPDPIRLEYQEHDYVFKGRVNPQEIDDRFIETGYFEVEMSWKGQISEIENREFSFNFWNSIVEDQDYVVFANKQGRGAVIPLCNRTATLTKNGSDNRLIEELNQITEPQIKYNNAQPKENGLNIFNGLDTDLLAFSTVLATISAGSIFFIHKLTD